MLIIYAPQSKQMISSSVEICFTFVIIFLKTARGTLVILFLIMLTKIINATLLFLPPFFMSWTQRSKTFSMYTKGLFLSNIVHKSV